MRDETGMAASAKDYAAAARLAAREEARLLMANEREAERCRLAHMGGYNEAFRAHCVAQLKYKSHRLVAAEFGLSASTVSRWRRADEISH